MKQKIIFIVLLAAGMYLPMGSKECGKACGCPKAQTKIQVEEKKPVATEDISIFPASPFTKSFFSL